MKEKMNGEITLLVFIETKQGLRQKQIDAYRVLAPLVLQEAGCLQYELKKVEGNDNEFVLIERWSSAEALAAHDVTPHMIAADEVSPTFRARPARVIKLASLG